MANVKKTSVSNPNPLANPKGVNLNCELCRKPAFIICQKCRVTYYCCVEHQNIDAAGIHDLICERLIPLRSPTPFLPSEEERHSYHKDILRQKHELIDLARTEGQKFLFEGKHSCAVPAAMQCLKFSIDVFGLASIELVSPYLILGEASVGLGQFVQGEEYLAQAQWTALKSPECSNAIKSKLFRNVAMLNAAKGFYEEATRNLADDIYHSSVEYGPDDINTSGGYFHLANVFFRQAKTDIADSLYGQVSQIWCDYLKKIVDERTRQPGTSGYFTYSLSHHDVSEIDTFDKAREAEGVQVLQSVYDMCVQQNFPNDLYSARSCYALAMLLFILGHTPRSLEFAKKAESYAQRIEPGDLVGNISNFVKYLEDHGTSS